MNKQELITKIEQNKYYTADTEYKQGFNIATNYALTCLKLVDEQQPNKHKKIKDIANRYDNQQLFVSSTPSHYQGTIQPIDLINAQDLNFNLGNVVKYVCRAGKKQGENILTDLEKAKDYINFEIQRVKRWMQILLD